MTKRASAVLVALGLMVMGAATASAQPIGPPTLSGGAVVQSSDVSLTSNLTDSSTANDSSAITFTMPSGFTFADLQTLSTDFNPVAGSPASGATTPLGCGGGSPRFSITLSSGKNVFVYLGPSPDFNSCALNTWASSGNLVGNNDTGRYDTSQVQAGTQSNTYSGALALVGSQQVTSISLVVDAGWAFSPELQTVLVQDVQINGQTFYGQQSGMKNAVTTCRAALMTLGKSAFEQKYGSNHDLRNAFGKCVSSLVHQSNNHNGDGDSQGQDHQHD